MKFPITRQTGKQGHVEIQTHGYEVDLIAARADHLILATVKSYLGSRGVVADHVIGSSDNTRTNKLYVLLNDSEIRRSIVRQAAKRYGYKYSQVQLGLFVGRFSGPTVGEHERRVRVWANRQRVGTSPILVLSLADMVDTVIHAATDAKQYRDNSVLMTMRLLDAADLLKPGISDILDQDD